MKPFHIIAAMLSIGAISALSQPIPPFDGYADQVSAREEAWARTNADAPKQIRIKFHVVRSSRWEASSAAPLDDASATAKVEYALEQINSIYSPSRISFELVSVVFSTPAADLQNIDSFDEKAKLMKSLISETDARDSLNIVVVPMRNLGFDGHADFPWGRNSLRQGSGVMVSDEYVFPFPVSPTVEGVLNPQILAHEIGHALGLHHVERGVGGHETSHPLLIQEAATVSADGDTKGDFCDDTPPISHFSERDLIYTPIPGDEENPEFTVVYKPERSVLRWSGENVANLMRVSGDRFVISPQQSQRMHSWIDARLSSWVIGTPASDPKVLLSNLYFDPQNKFLPGVRLTWSGSGGNHDVERSTSPTFQESDVLTSTAVNGWDDTGAEIGVDYWYRVKRASGGPYTYSRRMSVRGAGGSDGQKARPSHIPDLSPASAVRSIPGGVLVTWDDADDIDITGYQVLRWEVANPGSAPVKYGPITSAGGGKSSFFDVFTESEQRNRDKKDFHYQVLSFSGDYNQNPVFSGNIAAPREQGAALTYSATPPPAPPILSYTKYQDPPGTFKGRISVSYTGITPTPVTPGEKITVIISRSIDDGSAEDVYSGDLPEGVDSPILFTDSGLDTGKNYFYELSLSQMVETSNGTVETTQDAVDFSTTRIPGRITSAPVRGTPAAGAQGVFSFPSFTWSPVLDASHYRITINSAGIDPVTHIVPASQLSFSLTGAELEALRRYNWSVTATNEEGDGPASTKGQFTIGLRAVNLTSPSDGEQLSIANASERYVRPTFTWDGMPGAVEYRLRIFDGTGSVAYNSGFIHTNRHTVSEDVLNSGNYTWDVTTRPVDTSNPTPASFSAVRAFSVRSAPNLVPARYQPVDGVSGARQRPVFEWQKLSQATDYVIHIVQNSDISRQWRFGGETDLGFPNLLGAPLVGSPVVGDANRLQFEFPASLAELPGARKFYWRIRARNEIGNGDWSGPANPTAENDDWKLGWNSFTTRIDDPVIISPADGATIGDTSPSLRWTSGAGTVSNEVQVFAGSATTGTPIATQTVTDDRWDMPVADFELSDGAYVWRVRSIGPPDQDPLVVSGWTKAAFSVATPPRQAPTQTNPAQNQPNLRTTPDFQWKPLAKATSYDLQIKLGSLIVFDRVGVVGTVTPSLVSYALPPTNPLLPGKKYEWRVAGRNSVGKGDFSGWIPFYTKPATPAPGTPENNGSVNDRTPILRAAAVIEGATGYEFQLRRSAITEPVHVSGSSNNLSWTVTPELANGTYFWRVRAIGPIGSNISDWSGYFSFVVSGPPVNAPTMISPHDPDPNVTPVTGTVRPSFSWSALNLATAYDLQIKDATGGAVVMTIRDITGTQHRIDTALLSKHTYYWRVRGKNSFGLGPWSADPNNLAVTPWSEYGKFRTP